MASQTHFGERIRRAGQHDPMLRVTLDTGAVGPRRKVIEAACHGHDVDLANTTVTERELRGTRIAPLSEPIFETGVWGESEWGKSVWGGEPVREVLVPGETPLGAGVLAGDDSATMFDSLLAIIGDGSFPPSGQRDNLKPGQLNQLRDALILEAHTREKRDIFVTTDTTAFVKHGRRHKLERLCSTRIMTVDEFCDHMSSV
jgi:hypothetical protein